jgi:hypothetical protein
MQTSTHAPLVQFLLKGTRFGQVRWKPTAKGPERLTAQIISGHVATLWEDNVGQYLRLENSADGSQVLVTSAESGFVAVLYSEAKRKAYSKGNAILAIIMSRS